MKNHIKFMGIALKEAEKALKSGEFPVGCVMVHAGRVLADGRRVSSRADRRNELDHAEINAVRRLTDEHPGIEPMAVTVYSTLEPCLMCFSTMLLNGFRNFVYAYEDIMGGGTGLPLAQLPPLYSAMKPMITKGVCRPESLALFKKFFNSPGQDYWAESLLEDYTLKQ